MNNEQFVEVIGLTPSTPSRVTISLDAGLQANQDAWFMAVRKKTRPLEDLVADIESYRMHPAHAYNELTYMKKTATAQSIGIGCVLVPLATLVGLVLGYEYEHEIVGALLGGAAGLGASLGIRRMQTTGYADSILNFLENSFNTKGVLERSNETKKRVGVLGERGDFFDTSLASIDKVVEVSHDDIPVHFGDLRVATAPGFTHTDIYLLEASNAILLVEIQNNGRELQKVSIFQPIDVGLTFYKYLGRNPHHVNATYEQIYERKDAGMGAYLQRGCVIQYEFQKVVFDFPIRFERTKFERYAAAMKPYFTFQTA